MEFAFKKGDAVRMTDAGIMVLRLTRSGKVKHHRNGSEYSDTGIVMADSRSSTVRVRLDSERADSPGQQYGTAFWTLAEKAEKPCKCYVCEEPTNRPDVFRVISRGDQQGKRVGPLCADCESFMYTNALLED